MYGNVQQNRHSEITSTMTARIQIPLHQFEEIKPFLTEMAYRNKDAVSVERDDYISARMAVHQQEQDDFLNSYPALY